MSQPAENKTPSISYVVAAYNAARDIEVAIYSALAQRDVDVEVIVVDDASTDNTFELATNFATRDARVKVFRNKIGAGPAAARNRAIEHASKEWIGILDADDFIDPERSIHLLALAKNHGCENIADNLLQFQDKNPKETSFLLPYGMGTEAIKFDIARYLRANLMTGGSANLGFLKPVFKSEFLKLHGISYDEDLRIGEDFNFCLQTLLAGAQMIVTTKAFYHYRLSGTSLSRRLASHDLDAMIEAHQRLPNRSDRGGQVYEADKAYRRSLIEMRTYLQFREVFHGKNYWAVARFFGVRSWYAAVFKIMRRRLRVSS